MTPRNVIQGIVHPPPPLAISHPLRSPPPPPRETVTSMFFWLTSIALVCVAHLLYTWPCIAFPLLQINHLCVFCDVLSPKALYGCVVLLSQTQVLYRSFGSPITFVLDESHWHHIKSKVASHVFSSLASVEGTTVCLEIPLQPPPPPREIVIYCHFGCFFGLKQPSLAG